MGVALVGLYALHGPAEAAHLDVVGLAGVREGVGVGGHVSLVDHEVHVGPHVGRASGGTLKDEVTELVASLPLDRPLPRWLVLGGVGSGGVSARDVNLGEHEFLNGLYDVREFALLLPVVDGHLEGAHVLPIVGEGVNVTIGSYGVLPVENLEVGVGLEANLVPVALDDMLALVGVNYELRGVPDNNLDGQDGGLGSHTGRLLGPVGWYAAADLDEA